MSSRPQSLVTGAASGIGAALTQRLVSRGHCVLALDIDVDGLRERYSSDDAVVAGTLDVRDGAAWDRTVDAVAEQAGRLDFCFNVAGVIRPGWVPSIEADDVDRVIDVNLKGVIHGTRAAARVMVQQGHGHIVNVASLAAMAPVPGLGVYVASKYGVRGFGLTAAHELRELGVFVTTVCPDAVDTPMLDAQVGEPAAALTFSGAPQPLTVDEVVDVIVGRVITDRPVEVALPMHRGMMARAGDLLPTLASRIEPLLRRRGREAQLRRAAVDD
jgi:3-oxoacyl-[acyl-carrier protein] reductase